MQEMRFFYEVIQKKEMPPPGLEPGLPASEADALSSELRGRIAPEILPHGEVNVKWMGR
jgi:hypothetical protein